MITRDKARSLVTRIFSLSRVPELEVRLLAGRRAHLRFARSSASTSGVSDTLAIAVTAWKGKRRASVSASVGAAAGSVDESALRKLVSEAEDLAAFSPEDPEYLPPLGAQSYIEVQAYDTPTAEMPARDRAERVAEALATVKNRSLQAAGIYRTWGVVQVMANKAGLFGYFPWSRAVFSITVRTPDGAGSGFYAASSVASSRIDCKEVAVIAARKAVESVGARELAPGAYPAVLEPQAVADISPSLSTALNARTADEGRSVFSRPEGKTRIGDRMFDPRVNLYTDPRHPIVPGAMFSDEGYPAAKSYLIREGRLENLSNSRYWAAHTGRAPGPAVVNLILDGGDKSVQEMIASTERGVLLTRLWYVRPVDPQQALVTGLTRDGTFWIENGKIAHPIKNFRFNESLVRLLGDLDTLGTPQRVMSSEGMNYGDGSLPLMLPSMKVKSFRFTSLSDAV